MDARRQRELDLGIVHLLDSSTSGLASGNWLNSDDLNAVSSSTMTSSHIPIALGDSSRDGQVTVFTVHVMSSGTRVITKPDTEVLNLQGLLFPDLFNADNFASGFLELPQLTQKVPKSKIKSN